MSSGAVTQLMTRDAAEKLDGRIRRLADATGQQIIQIGRLLDEAKRGQIHQVLGFASWTAYVADALGGVLELSGESRQAVLELMSREGMSLRAIGAATGVPKSSVARELSQVSQNGTPAEVLPITGTDGKTYPRPTPAPAPAPPPRRQAFPNVFADTVRRLYGPVAAVCKLADDDRFASYAKTHPTNRAMRRSLVGVIAALQQVVDQLPDDGRTWQLVGMHAKDGPDWISSNEQ